MTASVTASMTRTTSLSRTRSQSAIKHGERVSDGKCHAICDGDAELNYVSFAKRQPRLRPPQRRPLRAKRLVVLQL